jgi:hypothetical protein
MPKKAGLSLSTQRTSLIAYHSSLVAHCPLLITVLLVLFAAPAAQAQPVEPNDETAPIYVDGVNPGDLFGVGRTVVVRGSVRRGVIAFGGDIIIEGRVEGDAATIGGSITQRAGSYVGGDVIVIGGTYHNEAGLNRSEAAALGRKQDSATIVFAGYQAELREIARHPASLLEPRWSIAYVGQRLLSLLFWFITSLTITAVTPDAVSRAAMRLQLTSLRVIVCGFLAVTMVVLGVPVSLKILPESLGMLVLLMGLLLVLVAYLFGRVAVHAATGRWLQRRFLAEESRSESLALLLGSGLWVAALSLPYVWPLIVIGLSVMSLGLALTARYRIKWRRN